MEILQRQLSGECLRLGLLTPDDKLQGNREISWKHMEHPTNFVSY